MPERFGLSLFLCQFQLVLLRLALHGRAVLVAEAPLDDGPVLLAPDGGDVGIPQFPVHLIPVEVTAL